MTPRDKQVSKQTSKQAWEQRMSAPLDVTIRDKLGRVILQTYRRGGKLLTLLRDPKTGRFCIPLDETLDSVIEPESQDLTE